jgi:Hint domain
MATTVTVGGFTLSGFDSKGYSNLAYDSTHNYNNGHSSTLWTSDDYFYNDSNTEVVTATGSTTDTWSLTVTLHVNSGNAASIYLIDGAFGAGSSVSGSGVDHNGPQGTASGTTLTFSGTGSAQLHSLLHNLNIQGAAIGDQIGVTFTLKDTTANASATFTTYFQAAACYVTGTRIAGPSGEVAVEDLNIGDLVATADGTTKPVKWIGRRSYTAAQTAANKHLRPVIIRQGALAENMPHRDLMVSPMHALFIDDVFVPAAALINGVTILRSEALEPVSYVHIELDDHDVVFAEGAPAETFVDDNSRLLFDNADEYYDLYGADETPGGFSAPRIEDGYQLEAIRRRLGLRAGLPVASAAAGELKGHVERLENGVLEGWVMDVTPNAAPVELDVLVEGEMVARVLANRYRTDLDHAGLAGGRCAFSVTLPASAVTLSQVELRRTIDGAMIPMPKIAALTA